MNVTAVSFEAGQNMTVKTIQLMGNNVYEGSEVKTFTVGLRATGVGGVNIGDTGTVIVRLTENDGKNLSTMYSN